MREVILASQSPRRQELLQRLVPSFSVQPADIDESMNPEMTPEQAVCDLARRKAQAIAQSHPQSLVIAADTIVVCDTIFGKPEDEADAARMLRSLSGRAHQVMTAVSVAGDGRDKTEVSVTDVHFRPMSETEIADYIATGGRWTRRVPTAFRDMGRCSSSGSKETTTESWGFPSVCCIKC